MDPHYDAIVVGGRCAGPFDGGISYQRTRDRLSEPLFDITERIASYHWDLLEIREHVRALSRAMRPELDALLELDNATAPAA